MSSWKTTPNLCYSSKMSVELGKINGELNLYNFSTLIKAVESYQYNTKFVNQVQISIKYR